jgi:hypothetical protein
MRHIHIARPLHIVWLVVSTFLLGCGAKTANVHGKVIFKNRPVTGGLLTFYSVDDPKVNPAIAIINEDGTYNVDNVRVGKVTATVDTRGLNPDNKGNKKRVPMRLDAAMPEDVRKKIAEKDAKANALRPKLSGKYIAIPDKFTDSEKSGLSYDIGSGSNEIMVELE